MRGVIVDTAQHPVSGVTIQAANGPSVVSDDSGRFRLEIGSGPETLDLHRIGFMASRYGLYAGHDTTVRIILLPVAQQLGAVNVNAHASDFTGFLDRMQRSKTGAVHGIFMDASQVGNRSRLTDVFRALPGVKVAQYKPNGYVLLGRQLTNAEDNRGFAPCTMAIYLDGARIGDLSKPTVVGSTGIDPRAAEVVDIDQLVQSSDVAGIEYYETPHDAPPQFQALNGSCGIVLIWTKRGSGPL